MNNNSTCVIILGKKDVDPLPKSIYESINACEVDVRKSLYANIVLSGGTSSFDGLPDRLDREIENQAKHLKNKSGTAKDMVKVMSGKKKYIFLTQTGFWGVFFGEKWFWLFEFCFKKDNCISN